jgi:hypothetical protein
MKREIEKRPACFTNSFAGIAPCCVPSHSVLEALQLPRLESKGHFQAAPPSPALLPVHPIWKLPSLGRPMTIEFERRSASLATAIYSQN